MTSSTIQHRSTPDRHNEGPSSPDRTDFLNDNGDVFHLTRFTGKDRQATKNQQPFIPLSDGAPINNLLIELLSYVFILGSKAEKTGQEEQEEEEDVAGKEGRHLPFQVLVSHVCRQWRAVAIETPTLWTYLDFKEGPPFDKSRTWLERSKECPLVIKLDCTEPTPGPEPDGSEDQAGSSSENELVPPGGPPLPLRGGENNKMLNGYLSPADLPIVQDLLLPHSARWSVFELIVYCNDFKFMLDMLSTLASIPEAPELRALSIHYKLSPDSGYYVLSVPAPFCGRAPRLRLVKLWRMSVEWEACGFLQGLEELELGYHDKDVRPKYEVFARILRGSPDLHTLKLCGSGPAGDEEDWPTDVIELPSVRQHYLAKVPPSYASALLKRFVFPNLSNLSLEFDPRLDYSAFIEQLASPPPKQRHSVCQNLVELMLFGQRCSDTALGTLYAALPNLISLTINCYDKQHQYFEYLFAMNSRDPDGFYLPKLTTLTTYGISVQRMSDLIRRRRKIKHVQMDWTADVDVEDAEYASSWLRAHTESLVFFDFSYYE